MLSKDPATLNPGELFDGRYKIKRRLGAGDRKVTYLAVDEKNDREVALSVVRPNAVPQDPGGTEREAKVLGRIGSHDNIVSLYESEIKAIPQYIVFEYLAGGTLAEFLHESGPLPPEKIYRLARQVCRGLAHLHDKGLIHRDVSPPNIWLDERGAAHLGDFDSAIWVADSSQRRPITTNSFAAPEEKSGDALDPRSDLFSLGGLLYVLAMGGDRLEDVRSLRSQRVDLPSSFADLVEALVASSPADRPADADAVLTWLEDIRHASNFESLLGQDESIGLEFKASLHHLFGPLPGELQKKVDLGVLTMEDAEKEARNGVQRAAAKTIAAFFNSEGGTLVIGVTDHRDVVGIEPDFPNLSKRQNADGWLNEFQGLVMSTLGPETWSCLRVSLVQHEGATVALVSCPRRAIDTWLTMPGKKQEFSIRTANGTEALEGPGLVKYVREHWMS